MIPGTSPARILIVDDSEDSADITAAFLEEGGFSRISFARSAAEAFDLIGLGQEEHAAGPFDLIIMDIMMPEVDGIEACARLRLHEAGRYVPILMLSAAREIQALNQAFVAGANDFVAKPVTQIDLLARVRTLLRFGREQDRRLMREAEVAQRNAAMQKGALGDAMVDPVTHLARGMMVEMSLRNCRETNRPAALALIQIDEYERYEAFRGTEETRRLLRTVATMLARTPAPMAAIAFYYGGGSFIIVDPGADSDEALCESAGTITETVKAAALPHGNALAGAMVSLSALTAWGEGDQLAALTGQTLARMTYEQKARGLYVEEG
ncbi:response regulator [Novosphingobium beihaiensis]|uniref:Response regulator n=1 Tax=Novosphingobium beihaiensis TaxID=2930389 RepID=A0ABT0BVN2_9SPHN|nr:response regulator [Novosphingobium beihaiensis]MCJ2188866.1 response regulator [Novosphingobium beihaiensis]